MTAFQDQFRVSSFPRLCERHGTAATFISDEDSSETSVIGFFIETGEQPGFYEDAKQTVYIAEFTINPDDVSNVITDNDSMSIDDNIWAVKRVGPVGALTKLFLERRKQEYVGGEKSRIQRS